MRLRKSIGVAGTHGKTTTTSLVGTILHQANFDPTVINGGIINAFGTNSRLGQSDWMVVETDESDGSFTRLPVDIAIVTNIDPEHMDHYGSFDAVRDAYLQFLHNLPFYGFAAVCIDHPEVAALTQRVTDRRLITYGKSEQADFRITNVDCAADGCRFDITSKDLHIKNLFIPMFGEHNVLNATAAVIVALELGIDEDTIRAALTNFAGVKRRFTKTGEANGVTIIDDYGHHPTEIKAVLGAARNIVKATGARIIAVVQPHRYTRVASLMEEFGACFTDADHVIISDIYSAGEKPIDGITQSALIERIAATGKKVEALPAPENLPALVQNCTQPGDYVICLGAGTITAWAASLPTQLAELQQQKAA